MNLIECNGLVHHVEDEGLHERPTIVFSNSLGTDLRLWDEVISELPRHFRTIRYDKRGHGLSEEVQGPYSIEELAADLASILDFLRVRNCLVIGVSIGGVIAQQLALSRPDITGALVLSNTAPKIGDESTWQERIAAIQDGGIEAVADGILERWFTKSYRWQKSQRVKSWKRMLCQTSVEGYLGCCHALKQANLRPEVGKISMETLFVAGDDDGATPPDIVEEGSTMLPGAQFKLIEGAGHLPCEERPTEFLSTVMEFVSASNWYANWRK